jgi:hypothetical protein
MERVRSSAWIERQPSKLMVAGSNKMLKIPPGPIVKVIR